MKKWIFPSLFFNEENLENQRFELNIVPEVSGGKTCGKILRNEKRFFFEILRKKEKTEF
tara:strand:- start:103 stop:279 length:177 start_codon:yes stop_codon:yes gene_type:complete